MPTDEITSSQLSPHCMRCMLDKSLDSAPADAPWRDRAEYTKLVMRTIADKSATMTAPELSHELSIIREELFGIKRDFTHEKEHFNELMLGMQDELAQRIHASNDPLDLAIRCALVGNFIDFGPTGDVSEKKLLQRELKAMAVEKLTARALPRELADALCYDSEAECLKGIDSIERAFRAAVQASVDERLRGETPIAGAGRRMDAEALSDADYYRLNTQF